MGEKAAQAASGPSCSHTSTFWSYFSFVKAPVVRYMTEMQVTQIMRSADDFTQAYPKDVAYALQRVSMGLGSGIYSAGSSLGSTVSKTLSPPRVAPGIPVDDED